MLGQSPMSAFAHTEEAKSTADRRSKGCYASKRKETSERRELKSRTRTGGNVESSDCGSTVLSRYSDQLYTYRAI